MVVMGQLGTPFGVKGWVRIFADTEYPDSLLDYPVWYLETATGWQAFDIEAAEMHAKGLVAKLAGIDDRNAAEELGSCFIGAPREDLPAPQQDEYYWADLVGLEVVNVQEQSLGRVESLIETGANQVLVVKDGERERLLPFVAQVVKAVDLAGRRIRVEWGDDW